MMGRMSRRRVVVRMEMRVEEVQGCIVGLEVK